MGRVSEYGEPHRNRLALRDRVHSHARVIRPANFIESLVVSRGTDGSNPVPSSRESGEIVGSATLAGRGRCFTAPRLFIWGLSISRAPLQAWAGNVLATSLSESGLGDDMA